MRDKEGERKIKERKSKKDREGQKEKEIFDSSKPYYTDKDACQTLKQKRLHIRRRYITKQVLYIRTKLTKVYKFQITILTPNFPSHNSVLPVAKWLRNASKL